VEASRAMAKTLGTPRPIILAVTILTSMDEDSLKEVGVQGPILEEVGRLAALAMKAGVDGVVASPQEIDAIRTACGDDFVIVTPGIRGTRKIPGDDQKRTWGPAEAVRAGANYLVVGRPIRTAEDPASEADDIVKEIANALTIRDNRP
jgi:orotidine-5'-phosphate decarboxylase